MGVVVGGIALAITGIGMLVMALTIGSRFGTDAPPGVGSLALGPALGGVGLLVFGVALAAGGVAVLSDAPRARLITGVLSIVAAAAAVVGTVLAMTSLPASPVIAIALTLATVVFGAAAVLLLRPRR